MSDNVAFPSCLSVDLAEPNGQRGPSLGPSLTSMHHNVSLGLIPGQWAGIKLGHEAGI